jgi:hypothetical protein
MPSVIWFITAQVAATIWIALAVMLGLLALVFGPPDNDALIRLTPEALVATVGVAVGSAVLGIALFTQPSKVLLLFSAAFGAVIAVAIPHTIGAVGMAPRAVLALFLVLPSLMSFALRSRANRANSN